MIRSRLLIGTVLLCPLAAGCGGGTKGTSSKSTATSASTPSTTGRPTTPPAAEGTEVSPGVVRGSADGLTATMHAGTHRPRAGAGWPISFSVTRGGRAARATVSYEYMLAGQVVARRSHYTFRGRFSDVFHWPSSAVGYPLTFRAVVESGAATVDLDYPVRVRR